MSNNQDQINSKDFLIGTLIGGIVGASVALLWAPKSGKELRNELNDQAIIVKEKGGQLAETAKQKTTTIIERVKSVSSQAQNEIEQSSQAAEDLVLNEDSIVSEEAACSELEQENESKEQMEEGNN